MRNIIIASGEHYHVFNRGNNKQVIFVDDRDRVRFLFLILHLQSGIKIWNIGYHSNQFTKHRVFSTSDEIKVDIVKNRYVELVNFALMPNHFHLTVHEVEENGIARYMQRVLNAYTKYFNTKYKKSGHLFQGPYKAVHINHDRQLLYLSAYIHRNPKELKRWHRRVEYYPWSSYQDYIKENRWGALLQNSIIRKQFSRGKEYRTFVETSGAKEIASYLDEEHRII
ncbi:MAG: transposase [Candidatus Niyogibacteria bacterium]|nr:transposase [Candidatus Niyogibacteria bacterium]